MEVGEGLMYSFMYTEKYYLSKVDQDVSTKDVIKVPFQKAFVGVMEVCEGLMDSFMYMKNTFIKGAPRCQHEGCDKGAISKGFCWSHGGL